MNTQHNKMSDTAKTGLRWKLKGQKGNMDNLM